VPLVGPEEERRHAPGPDAGWQESWSFDFIGADGALGGFVRLILHPSRRTASYWAYVTGPGRPLVAVRDHEVEPPRGRDLEVRAAGLWAQVICETPLDHWSAGLEAFAVAIDDPVPAAVEERGDPVPLGLDLEWEMAGPPAPVWATGGYAQPAQVHGDVLVGAERLACDGLGWHTHRWGVPPGGGWWSLAAHLDDGLAVAASAPGRAWVWPAGGGDPAGGQASLDVAWSPGGLPGAGQLIVDGRSLPLTVTAPAPVALEADGRGDVLVRALCVLDRDGRAWAEWRRAAPVPGPAVREGGG
jgi:hypothetical protein